MEKVSFRNRKKVEMTEERKSVWRQWLKAAGIRAIKTVAQTAVATIGTTAVISEVNWAAVVGASVLAGILSLLTSLAGIPEAQNPFGSE